MCLMARQCPPIPRAGGKLDRRALLEAFDLFPLGFADFDVVHFGCGWSFAAEADQFFEGVVLTYDQGLHLAAPEIADPAVYPQRVRLAHGPAAVEDALHPAADQE